MERNEVLIMKAQMKMNGRNNHDVMSILVIYDGIFETPDVYVNPARAKMITECAMNSFIDGGNSKRLKDILNSTINTEKKVQGIQA